MPDKLKDCDIINLEAINIIKKIQGFLLNQEKILDKYLLILKKEQLALDNGDTDKLVIYSGMRNDLEKELISFQKVISSLEGLFGARYRELEFLNEQYFINSIKDKIENLKKEIMAGIALNRDQLHTQLVLLKTEIQKLPKQKFFKSVFNAAASPAFIDITK